MPIINVKNLSKQFIIPHERIDSIRENFVNLFRRNTSEKFNAVDNLTFSVEKGEFFGIIGRNGSGKSTLLKMLAGIYSPTKGDIEINGTIAPFLELGVGFNPELTGKENVYLNGSILGLSEKQIKDRYLDIVNFAELERFMDQKLKNYSSGMQVRLAFSIAIQADTDILLLDEVLAVGDMDFQRKCYEKFREFKKAGKTIVFVTHDLGAIRQFCDKALYIKNGECIAAGDIHSVVDKYIYEDRADEVKEIVEEIEEINESKLPTERGVLNHGGEKIKIDRIEFIDKNRHINNTFITGDSIEIKITLDSKIKVESPNIGFIIYDEKNNYIFGSNTEIKREKLTPIKEGINVYTIKIPKLPLLTGKYYLTVAISEYDYTTDYVWRDRLFSFYVNNPGRNLGLIEIDYQYHNNFSTIEIKSKKHGFKLNFDDKDFFVGHPVSQDVYEPYESELFMANIDENSVVFDIGANIGYYSILASLKINTHGTGKIFAFEPSAKNFSLLKRNIEINDLKNIQCLNFAVGDKNGKADLYLSGENQGDHQLYYSEDRPHESCKLTTIDTFIREIDTYPDIIKIDTQGYDLFVLKGMKDLLESNKSLVLFTEFWDHGNKNSGASSSEYYEFLKHHFTTIHLIDEETKETYPINFEQIMEICSKNNKTMHVNLFCKR